MNEEKNNGIYGFGKVIGFLLSYTIFTSILYLILQFSNKLPESWTILHVVLLTILIIMVGKSIRFLLK